jgi:hypothetical protein
MGKPKLVTLVCTSPAIPYVEGDIFSVEEDVAARLLSKEYKGNLRVRKYDANKDAELLAEQRGKTEDVEPEAPTKTEK